MPGPQDRRPTRADIDVAGVTDGGRVRTENQDQYIIASVHRTLTLLATSLDPDEFPDLRSPTRGYIIGVADGVVFPGYRSDVPEILSLFDVYVLMSRREALGTSVLEAMAMERAVVVSNVGGLSEAVVEGTGLRCRPGDIEGVAAAIAGLLDDPERRRRCGEAARRHVVAHYSDRQLADQAMALYERVLRKGSAPA